MSVMRMLVVAASLLSVAISGIAIAQEEEAPVRAIGAGISAVAEPYRALEDDLRIIPVPLLFLDGGRFSISGTSASLRLYKNDMVEVAAMGAYRFNGYDADDSPVFEGMEDRNSTLEAGGWVALNLGDVFLTTYLTHDVLDEHGGFQLRGQAAYSWNPHVATNVTPSVGVLFQSEDMSDYYFGVRPDEALTIANFDGGTESFVRNAYAPGETMTPYVSLSIRQALSPKWAVFFSGRYEFLPDEVTESPLIDSDSRAFAGIALGRLF